MTEQIYSVILLPWLKLQSSFSVLGVRFHPYTKGQAASMFQSFSNDVDRILASYRDMEGNPISECVLGFLSEDTLCNDLTDDNADLVNQAVQLVTLSGLATNQYFTQLGHYTNSTAFQVFFHRFRSRSEELCLVIRRRDGRLEWSGYKHGQIKFSVPVQCANLEPAHLDTSLLKAFDQYFKIPDEQTRRLLQAITLYNGAHTDSDAVLPEREITLLANAFEQLFANCDGAEDLACKVGTLLDSYGAITVGDSTRIGAIQLSKGRESQERAWYLHRKWTQELYHRRNDFNHGNDPARRPWGWSVLEHLVMASFVFPLLVKVLLSQASKYSLLKSDHLLFAGH